MKDGSNNPESVAGVAGDGPSFRVSEIDRTMIRSIVARAFRDSHLRAALHFIVDGDDDARQTLTMDLSACHANGCPIDLVRLLDADDVSFGHDITGIQRHIDRRTGKLRRAFGPRTMMTDDQRKGIADALARREEEMKNLLSAAEHAGAARANLEFAKRQEVAKAAAEARRRKARNARRRKGKGTKSSHSPRAAKRKSAPPATRRPGRR